MTGGQSADPAMGSALKVERPKDRRRVQIASPASHSREQGSAHFCQQQRSDENGNDQTTDTRLLRSTSSHRTPPSYTGSHAPPELPESVPGTTDTASRTREATS